MEVCAAASAVAASVAGEGGAWGWDARGEAVASCAAWDWAEVALTLDREGGGGSSVGEEQEKAIWVGEEVGERPVSVRADRSSAARLAAASPSPTPETQHKVQHRFLLDVVVSQGAPILQLLAPKDEALLVRGDALLVLPKQLAKGRASG